MILSVAQAMADAAAAGFSGAAQAIIVAIATAESSLSTLATNLNTNGTTDRGVLQINSVHSDVTDACAFDPVCAFRAAFSISKGGQDFSPWVTYNTGAYRQYLGTGAATVRPAIFDFFLNNPITQAFGINAEQGVDYGVPYGTSVPALWGGKVLFAGRTQWSSDTTNTSGGLVEVLANIPGLGQEVSYYLHLDTTNLKVGDTIQPGDIVGTSGGQLSGGNWPASPQYSSGPHIEVGFNAGFLPVSGPGKNVNPLQYIQDAVSKGSAPYSGGTTATVGFDPLGLSGVAQAITDLPNTILKDIAASDVVQRSAILFIALVILVLGVAILFFSDPNNKSSTVVVPIPV